MIGSKIHDKLITDFKTFTFEGGSTMFANVEKYFAIGSMDSGDCLITPDSNNEIVEGQSAGNTATTRIYAFRATVVEFLESTTSNADGSTKYSRLLNIQDKILDYIQKEPSNLNGWGQSQSPTIDIFKIRLQQIIFDQQVTEKGYAEVMDVRFNVSLNITPQLL